MESVLISGRQKTISLAKSANKSREKTFIRLVILLIDQNYNRTQVEKSSKPPMDKYLWKRSHIKSIEPLSTRASWVLLVFLTDQLRQELLQIPARFLPSALATNSAHRNAPIVSAPFSSHTLSKHLHLHRAAAETQRQCSQALNAYGS